MNCNTEESQYITVSISNKQCMDYVHIYVCNPHPRVIQTIADQVLFFNNIQVSTSVQCVLLKRDTRDGGGVRVEGELRAALQGFHQINGDAVDVLHAVRKEHEVERGYDAAWRQMRD